MDLEVQNHPSEFEAKSRSGGARSQRCRRSCQLEWQMPERRYTSRWGLQQNSLFPPEDAFRQNLGKTTLLGRTMEQERRRRGNSERVRRMSQTKRGENITMQGRLGGGSTRRGEIMSGNAISGLEKNNKRGKKGRKKPRKGGVRLFIDYQGRGRRKKGAPIRG